MSKTTKLLNKKKAIPPAVLIIIGIVAIVGLSFLFDPYMQKNLAGYENETLTQTLAVSGSLFAIVIFLLIIPTFLLWKEKREQIIVPLWLSILITGLVAEIIKFIVQRQRPFGMEYIFTVIPDYAFPSLHTALASAPALLLLKAYPTYRYAIISYVAIVGVSRIYLKAHYFSDVVAGEQAQYGCGADIAGWDKGQGGAQRFCHVVGAFASGSRRGG